MPCLGVGMLLLSGCGTASFDPTLGAGDWWQNRQNRTALLAQVQLCPPLVEYDDVFAGKAALELEALAPTSPLLRLVEDYGALREAIRNC